MKPALVIINTEQFGYHIDTYYYCKYLMPEFSATVICWDHGLDKIKMPGVKVEYVNRSGGVLRIVRLVRQIWSTVSSRNTIIFIKYFKVISTLVLILRPFNPKVLDIRSASIEPNPLRRFVEDLLLKIETLLFHNVTIISESLARKLGFEKRTLLLPIGADMISATNKQYNELALLYVGTLYNRRIEDAVIGLAKFRREFDGKCPLKFSIIGAGIADEISKLNSIAEEHGVSDIVYILGRIAHDRLGFYFDSHNIGVSYIPMTPYYDVQPATKTFEYLLSGMPVIATATSENKLVINQQNGVLIDDTPDAFCQGLFEINKNLSRYDSAKIRQDAQKYGWKEIVGRFDKYLHRISQRASS